MSLPTSAEISLAAVIMAVTEDRPRLLVVDGDPPSLPSGPLPERSPTLELALRGWVREQTGIELDYTEQLYTFGDLRRDPGCKRRQISIATLALTREAATSPGASWIDVYRLLPWEDRRPGRSRDVLDAIEPQLREWAGDDPDRRHRIRLTFGLDGSIWDGIRSLERFELLYEAGLVTEHIRDRGLPTNSDLPTESSTAMAVDHRRITATAIGRLRGKLTYRPVVFELLPEVFTLRALQEVVEALAGTELHTQNFRRLVEHAGLVEGTGRHDTSTGGRPAELFRFRAEVLLERPRPGVGRPSAWG